MHLPCASSRSCAPMPPVPRKDITYDQRIQHHSARAGPKKDLLLTLLQTGTGVSLDDMIEATGWQAHTVRAATTGLRKRGYRIKRHLEGTTTAWLVGETGMSKAAKRVANAVTALANMCSRSGAPNATALQAAAPAPRRRLPAQGAGMAHLDDNRSGSATRAGRRSIRPR